MRLFLAVLEGPNPQDAVPVFATEDRDLIRAVGQALATRLELGEHPGVARIMELSRRGWEGNNDA